MGVTTKIKLSPNSYVGTCAWIRVCLLVKTYRIILHLVHKDLNLADHVTEKQIHFVSFCACVRVERTEEGQETGERGYDDKPRTHNTGPQTGLDQTPRNHLLCVLEIITNKQKSML